MTMATSTLNSIVSSKKKEKKSRLCGKLPVVHRQHRVPSTSLDKMVKRERENGVQRARKEFVIDVSSIMQQ